MPVASTLHEYVVHLHEQGVLNLDAPLRSLVGQRTLDAIPRMPTDIIIGPRYCYVTALPIVPDLNQVASVAEDVRAHAGQRRPSPATKKQQDSTPELDATFEGMGSIGLINLDSTLRTLIQPDGIGGIELNLREGGPSVFITENYLFVHFPGATRLGDVSKAADAVRTVTGG